MEEVIKFVKWKRSNDDSEVMMNVASEKLKELMVLFGAKVVGYATGADRYYLLSINESEYDDMLEKIRAFKWSSTNANAGK